MEEQDAQMTDVLDGDKDGPQDGDQHFALHTLPMRKFKLSTRILQIKVNTLTPDSQGGTDHSPLVTPSRPMLGRAGASSTALLSTEQTTLQSSALPQYHLPSRPDRGARVLVSSCPRHPGGAQRRGVYHCGQEVYVLTMSNSTKGFYSITC